jgi:hypothetical protein
VATFLARVRIPLLWASIACAVLATVLGLPWWLPLVVLSVAFAVYLRVGTVRAPEVTVRAPVTGRWTAVNGPADKVPSHGLHAYGQTYAVDLLHIPSGDGEVTMELWPVARRPEEFPSFGRPVVAAVDGEVVRSYDRARDHLTRTSWWALLYLLTIEAFVRELRGPVGILGNHVVIRGDDGTYALVAHLRRGSVSVEPGQRVTQGDVIGMCGNSGNSSEPHVHVQVMDRASPVFAAGLPMRFDAYEIDGEELSGLPPARGVAFTVPERAIV